MTANVGVVTPSQNLNARSMSYDPALFFGNVSAAHITVIQLAPATGGIYYEKGLILAQYTSGTNVGLYVNYVTGGTNGQGTAVMVLIDDRIPLLYNTPAANDRFTAVYGNAALQLANLTTTLANSADTLAALATIVGSKIINGKIAYLP